MEARLVIRSAIGCGLMSHLAEMPQKHHPGNRSGQTVRVIRYYA